MEWYVVRVLWCLLTQEPLIGAGLPRALGRVDSIQQLSVDSEVLVMQWFVGIGDAKIRKKIVNNVEMWFDKLKEGLRPRWATLIHPFTSFPVECRYSIGAGSLICAGAVVQPNVNVGKHVVLNTSCSVDHDSVIEDFANVMPRACLCGITLVGEGTVIGAGAVVIQTKKIGKWSIVGAGATVLGDVPDGVTVVGLIRKNHQERV